MNTKRLLRSALLVVSLCLFFPDSSHAIDPQTPAPNNSFISRVREKVEYFFAFTAEKKVQVLEKQAEKRLTMAKSSAEAGDNNQMQNLLQNYLQIKDQQNGFIDKTLDNKIIDTIEDRTVEQQKTMEEIKNVIDENGKEGVMEVQEQVVNQVAQNIIEVNGKEGATEFFNKVEHIWAPGTGPGEEAGVVIEGGSMQFAPGTSGGGSSGSDIKSPVIEGNK